MSQEIYESVIKLILNIIRKRMTSPKLDFLSPNREAKYQATTNSAMTPISSAYKQYNYTSLVQQRQYSGNPISLILPSNTDSVELNIKVKFKDTGSELLKNMDPPLYTSPWRNSYQQNYILPSLNNRPPLEFMQLPVYKNTDFHNSLSQDYSRTSYKSSFNVFEQQHQKNDLFQKQKGIETRKTNSIDEQNPMFPKNVSSGIRKTQSNTFYQTKDPLQNLNKNKIGKPVPSAFNTFGNMKDNSMSNNRYMTQEHPSVIDYGRISERELSNQGNILRNFQDNLYNSNKLSENQINNKQSKHSEVEQINKPSVQQISHKYTKSQQFYPMNEDYQPVSFDYIPEKSFQNNQNYQIDQNYQNHQNHQKPKSRISNSNSRIQPQGLDIRGNNYTINQQQSQHSNSLSKQNSQIQQNIHFNQTFRQTVSIVPPYQTHQIPQQPGSSNLRSSSTIKTPSVINRPSSIQQSFQVQQPSQFQGLVQFKRTSSIIPSEQIQFNNNNNRNNSNISNNQPQGSSIQNNRNVSSISSPNLDNIRQQSNESQLKYSQSNRPSLISNFGEIMQPLVSPHEYPNQLNFNSLANSAIPPIRNTDFSRTNPISNSNINTRRSSRSPERQIFVRPHSQSGRISFNTLKCPYNKLVLKRGISLTKLERKIEKIGVPESIARRWDSMAE